jgi:hypothetical protein
LGILLLLLLWRRLGRVDGFGPAVADGLHDLHALAALFGWQLGQPGKFLLGNHILIRQTPAARIGEERGESHEGGDLPA